MAYIESATKLFYKMLALIENLSITYESYLHQSKSVQNSISVTALLLVHRL